MKEQDQASPFEELLDDTSLYSFKWKRRYNTLLKFLWRAVSFGTFALLFTYLVAIPREALPDAIATYGGISGPLVYAFVAFLMAVFLSFVLAIIPIKYFDYVERQMFWLPVSILGIEIYSILKGLSYA